jgi:glycosyltransferase involved in cell wall biosynthesis
MHALCKLRRFECRAARASIMATPLVSVVMTADNGENYLAKAIEGVLASSFTDFELINADDGCYDRVRADARRLVQGRFGWRRLGKEINLIVAEVARPRTE